FWDSDVIAEEAGALITHTHLNLGQDNIIFHNLRSHQGIDLVKDQDFYLRTVVIFDGDNCPRGAVALGETTVHSRDNAADDHLLTIAHLATDHGGQGGIRLGRQGIFEAIEWVPRDIKTQHFSLEGELVLAVPGFLGNIDSKSRYGSAFIAAEAGEEIELALICRLLRRLHR